MKGVNDGTPIEEIENQLFECWSDWLHHQHPHCKLVDSDLVSFLLLKFINYFLN